MTPRRKDGVSQDDTTGGRAIADTLFPGEYRTHISVMDQIAGTYSWNDNAQWRLNQKIKDTLDPKGIIAPVGVAVVSIDNFADTTCSGQERRLAFELRRFEMAGPDLSQG